MISISAALTTVILSWHKLEGKIIASGGNVRISMQDYKSLRVAVMIYAIQVNTQIHTQTTFDQL